MVRALPLIAALTFICCSAETALAQDQSKGEPSGQALAKTSDAPEIVPGILERERAGVLQKILKAKAQGCGIAGYMDAFQALQQSIGKGEAESVIRPRLETISKAVDDQLARSKALKTQRPNISPYHGSGSNIEPGPAKASKDDPKTAEATQKPKAVTPPLEVGVGAWQRVPEGRFKDAKIFGQ
jgi:hypothetical protein